MDFTLSPKVVQLQKRVSDFMNAHVYTIEKRVEDEMNVHGKEHVEPEILKEVRKKAKAEGLWNLFMPDEHYGKGLKVAEYAPLSELMGRSPIGSRAFNCMAPDTGNMEILADFGTAEQKKRWLEPCLEGTMRTCYSMTEPETAGSDPTQLATRAVRDGDYYVINGHKWFTSGAVGASFAIAMVVTDPTTQPHRRASQIIVPTDTPGFQLVRAVSVMGHAGGGGHWEIIYKDCPRAGDQPARRGRQRFRNRAGATGSGPNPSLHADGRRGRAGTGADVQAGGDTFYPRQRARGQGQHPAMDRGFADRDRRHAPDGDACGMEDRHRRQARGAPERSRKSRCKPPTW